MRTAKLWTLGLSLSPPTETLKCQEVIAWEVGFVQIHNNIVAKTKPLRIQAKLFNIVLYLWAPKPMVGNSCAWYGRHCLFVNVDLIFVLQLLLLSPLSLFIKNLKSKDQSSNVSPKLKLLDPR